MRLQGFLHTADSWGQREEGVADTAFAPDESTLLEQANSTSHCQNPASPGVGPGWLISIDSVAVPPKGSGEEAEDKPIKAHPEQRGNPTQSVSSSFHTGGRWLALW